MLGRWGQKQAERFYKRSKLRMIARNYSCQDGEIDIILTRPKDGVIVFAEVKTRRNEDFATAQSAVDTQKRSKIKQTAKCFLRDYNLMDRPLRFDIITVILGEKGKPTINHFPDAFR